MILLPGRPVAIKIEELFDTYKLRFGANIEYNAILSRPSMRFKITMPDRINSDYEDKLTLLLDNFKIFYFRQMCLYTYRNVIIFDSDKFKINNNG